MSGEDLEVDREAIYEVDPALQALGRPVDPPDRAPVFADVVTRTDNRRPIVPASMRSREQRHQLAGWAVRLGGHTLAYHVTRTPKYALKVLWRAPIGAGRLTAKAWKWAVDWENMSMRQVPHVKGDYEGWSKLKQKSEARERLPIAGVVLGVSLVAVCAFGAMAPWYAVAAVSTVAVIVLARAGSPIGKPITDRVVEVKPYVKLTAEMTRAAIMATGKVKEPKDIEFRREIYRDGPGHLAVLTLPPGVIATDVVDKREQLAGGFRLPLDQVWPDTVRGEHPGVLQIWVADRPVSAMRQPRSPLLDDWVSDYFAPFPYGADVRLRPVTWRLDERNSLFGGVPGSGKSLAARNVMLGAVLDPLVIPVISELKGSGDYDMFEPLCPKGFYISGADEASIAQTVRIIDWLHHLCEERGPLVAKYAREGMNSVKKVNRAMAERDERLRPVVAMFDEVQEFMSSPFGIKGGGAAKLLSAIKRARALGIHVIVATQRFDKESMPKAISSLVTNRACLAVPAQPETDMVLGTSAYRTGARPNAFVPGDDSGWMVRAGFTAGHETVRGAYLDDKAAEAICERALAMRNGVAPEAPIKAQAYSLLEDVRAVWPDGEEAMWSELIVPLLASFRPDVYGDWDVKTFGAAMKAAGVRTQSIHRKLDGDGVTRYGVRKDALEAGLDSKRDSVAIRNRAGQQG